MTQPLSAADPAELGFDPDRLHRLNTHFDRYVDDGRLTSYHLAVTRHGKLAHDARYGLSDREGQKPVAADTIWRIYSMTKPIVSVAAMMLWEEGLFELKDPVSKFIPEFADQKVWRAGSVTTPVLEPLMEPMRIWHLMTHTSGLTYNFMMAHPVDELYRRGGFDMTSPNTADLATICSRLAGLPLLFQPGSEWNYSMSIDVLGRIIEVISGQSLDEFLRTRVFGPLGMNDTGFSVPAQDADRLAALYGTLPGMSQAVLFAEAGKAALSPPAAFLGGGGLVSTMADYLSFSDMLRRSGELDGARVLSSRTVRYMTQNHLPGGVDLTAYGRALFSETPFDGVGFGLLGSVTIDPVKAKLANSLGSFGWGGAASTFFWVDPLEDITCVFMTQLLPSNTHPIRSQLQQLVTQALVD